MKKIGNFLFLTPLLLLGLCHASCTKNDDVKKYSSQVRVVKESATLTSIRTRIEVSKYTSRYIFAIGRESDEAAFLDGTYEGIIMREGSDPEVKTFYGLEEAEEYVVFAQGVNLSGEKGQLGRFKVSTVDRDDYEPSVIVAEETGDTGTQHLFIRFTPNRETVSYKFAIGRTDDDRDAFLAGTLGNIVAVENNDQLVYKFDGLAPDTPYRIFAQGVNEIGTLSELVDFPAATVHPSTLPLKVLLAEGKGVTSSTVTFKVAVEETTAYVEYGIGTTDADKTAFENGELEGVQRHDGDQPFYASCTGLEPNTVYRIYVRAVNLAGLPGPMREITLIGDNQIKTNPATDKPEIFMTYEFINKDKMLVATVGNDKCAEYKVSLCALNVYRMWQWDGYKGNILMTILAYKHTEYGHSESYVKAYANNGHVTDVRIVPYYPDFSTYTNKMLAAAVKGINGKWEDECKEIVINISEIPTE